MFIIHVIAFFYEKKSIKKKQSKKLTKKRA